MTIGIEEDLSARERIYRGLLLGLAWMVEYLDAELSLDVTRHDLHVGGLPPELDGFTIAQISDLHVGPGRWKPQRWRDAADAVDAVRPDLVLNCGDFLQWEPPPAKARSVFERFLARASRGVEKPETIAILGNHDYYAGDDFVNALAQELEDEGVRVLTNEGTCVQRGHSGISVFGLTTHRPGLDNGIAQLLDSGRPRVVLIHEPDVAACIPAGSADLVLAGHTHGGQITLPLLEPFIVRRFCGSQYVEGWYRVNDNPMYVNRGLGCTGYPVRFRARPEVSFIRLVR